MNPVGVLFPTNHNTNGNIGDYYNHNPFSFAHKHNQLFLKYVVCFLLLGFVYRYYFSTFTQFPPILDSDTDFLLNKTFPPPVPVVQPPESGHSPVNESQASHSAKCDIFDGEWVPDPTAPYYTNNSCQSIEEHQNCMRNGRPDSGYVYWRWTPRDCKLARFDPRRFLGLMRNKTMAFIGDSISRNHVQSLLCILSQVEEAVPVYHDERYASRRWIFPISNFTLSVIWSPFLIKAVYEDMDGIDSNTPKLFLDELDPLWVHQYKNFDYIEIGGGKWFLKNAIYYENNTLLGCHNCKINNITEIGFVDAYRRVINLSLEYITSSNHKVYTFFRTCIPDHFENGEWNTGGYCNRTIPFKGKEIDLVYVDEAMRNVELEEFEKAAVTGSKKGLALRLFDATHLSLLRPDGHPGPYRVYQPFSGGDKEDNVQKDCLHWCLPGPIDSWNELMLEMLLNG